MCQSDLTEYVSELTEFPAELSEFSLPKQYSRNSIPPVPYTARGHLTECNTYNFTPILVLPISGNSQAVSRTMITSVGSYRCCAPMLRRVTSTPGPDTFEKYRDAPPSCSAILWQKYALLAEVLHTPTICITIRLPFVWPPSCGGAFAKLLGSGVVGILRKMHREWI